MGNKASLSDLRARFRSFAVEPETLFLLNSQNAIGLIESAVAEGERLAGIEGFEITTAGAYTPRQEFSNDIAEWRGPYSTFVESTKELIRRGAAIGIRFQVVFDNE